MVFLTVILIFWALAATATIGLCVAAKRGDEPQPAPRPRRRVAVTPRASLKRASA
jgi:hypothetical protein